MAEWLADTTIPGRLRFQAEACERLGSRLYAGLLHHAVEDFEARGPTWEVLRGHEDDPGGSALALRLMGAVNRLVLEEGREPELAAVYSGPELDPAAAWRTFRAVLERNAEDLRQLVDLPVQTNEVGRCAALLYGFLTVAAETGLPLRLLEVGASAGLNLRWDRYRYEAGELSWGPADSPVKLEFDLDGGRYPAPASVDVVERHGCDTAPLDPATQEGQLALLAYVWPDQSTRIARMKAAFGVAERVAVSIDREAAASWTGRRLAESAPGLATVLYHSVVAQYLSADELSEFEGHVRAAGGRATPEAPLAWLRMETAGRMADLRLTTWPGGDDRLLARVGYHGSPIELRR